MTKRSLLAAALAILPLALRAQTAAEKPPLPDGPLLNAPADFSTWQINYFYATDARTDDGKPAPKPAPSVQPGSLSLAAPRRLTVTRTKPYWHAVLETVDGRRSENWSEGTTQIFKADGLPAPLLVTKLPDGRPLFPNYEKMGFPEMEWVSAQTYTGVGKVSGRNCLIFESAGMKAYVDADTRYPVAWTHDKESRTFVQLEPPADKIVLPPEVLQVAQSLKHDRERVRKLPPP